ncbi:hypothetical protein Plec18167_000470 [Paecilomyces lecythidis]|uniref:Mediator of RNA polymerase II transcription subunit 1 n=1 Tax=Paecilomyces lecythidis TaxID=3004212 RepID=A0ABR3YE05_9EURO
MATPSSKPNPGATPTHLTSSPRPSSVPMARPLSHKSPSMKTPSASGHVHGHHQSSHQNATPLAAATSVDDPVTFSSPSALLALGGYTGISPSPAAQDALAGSHMHENDIHALGMQGLGLGGARDNDEERRKHIEEVVQLLRTRVAGRGVCREGIERIGQLEGFESIWQDNNLSIAGNSVDLEIEFYPGQDSVKDVSLSYATPEAQEGVRRDEATAVLKRDLMQSDEERQRGIWKRLDGFYGNLERLARLDRLSQEVNCFEATEGLYESLRRIWEEEKKHPRWASTYEHLCKGWIGRPSLHKGRRFGLGLEFWVNQHRALDAKEKKRSPDSMVVDQVGGQETNEEPVAEDTIWSVTIECEEGYPSLRVSKDWVGSDVLTSVDTGDTESTDAQDETSIRLVNWTEPPPTLTSSAAANADSMAIDSGMLGSQTPNRRFVAKLEPPVDVPILAASDIYRHLGLQLPQEFKMVTYDALLLPSWTAPPEAGASDDVHRPGGKRLRKGVVSFDSEGKQLNSQHSYAFQAFETVAGRTLRDLPFSHPRQLADIFPILRQYALLASLLRNVFSYSGDNKARAADAKTTKTAVSSDHPSGSLLSGTHVSVLTNHDPTEDKLDALLKNANVSRAEDKMDTATDEGPYSSSPNKETEFKVDITLRTQIGQAPMIMLLFPAERETGEGSTLASERSDLRMASLNIEIGLNGRISINQVQGVWGDEEAPNGNGLTSEGQELQKKLAKVLETSEDLGVLVEWILRWVRRRRDRA